MKELRTALRDPATRKWQLVTGLVAAVCWLASLHWITGEIGLLGVVVGLPVAGALAAVVVAVLRWVGRGGPPRLLWTAFIWGAAFAAPASLLVDPAFQSTLAAIFGPGSLRVLTPMVTTPVTEELLKGLFVLGLLFFPRRRIGGLVDGIVYAGVAAAGFAFTENILYFGRAITTFLAAPGDDVTSVALLVGSLIIRALALPLHPVFTCWIGIGVAVAATSRVGVLRVGAVLLGFLVAIGLHATWDATALVTGDPGFLLRIYGFVMLPALVVLAVVALRARRNRPVLSAGTS